MATVIWKTKNITDNLGWKTRVQSNIWSPPTDIFEVKTGYIVRVEVAGMLHQEFFIQLDDNILFISGSRIDTPDRRAFHQMEIHFGEFRTFVVIPGPVIIENISAEYHDGFLIIVLPKQL